LAIQVCDDLGGKRRTSAQFLLAGLLMIPLSAASQTLDRDVPASAGGTCTGGGLTLGFTVGESVVGGSSTSPDQTLIAGFWGPNSATAVDVGEDPGQPAGQDDFGIDLAIRPNPFEAETVIRFRAPTASGESPGRVRIFDSSGRLVRTWATENSRGSVRMLAWDGLDRNGRAVPAGVYFCHFNVGSWSATRRLVRIH